jgi:hypothetical protein
MFTVPIPPFPVLVEIGKLHHPPRANQRVGSLSGALREGNGDQQEPAPERMKYFHFRASKAM